MSYRNTDNEHTYARSLLANAVESDMQNEEEREYLRKYKKTIYQLESEQRELSKIKGMIKKLSSEEGATNTTELEALEETVQDLSILIYHYKQYLFKLEITPPLRGVVERESVNSYLKQQEKEAEEIMKRQEQRQSALQRLNEQKQETLQVKQEVRQEKTNIIGSILASIPLSVLGLLEFYLIYGITLLVVSFVFWIISYIPILNILVEWLLRLGENTPDMFAMMVAVTLAYFGTVATTARIVKKEKTLKFTLILMGICLLLLNAIFLIINSIYHDAILINIILSIVGVVIIYKGKTK
jgi:hypothetical protein